MIKDFELSYRIANVSTLKQKEKEIIKNRSESNKSFYLEIQSSIKERINGLNLYEKFLGDVSNLVGAITKIKGEALLGSNERIFLLKRSGIYFLLINLFFSIGFFINVRRYNLKEEEAFEARFWHIYNLFFKAKNSRIRKRSLSSRFSIKVIGGRDEFVSKSTLVSLFFKKLFQLVLLYLTMKIRKYGLTPKVRKFHSGEIN